MRPVFFARGALRGLRRSSAPALAALLTVACVVVSAVGSGLTLRRFVRV
jgi:hypothetical protein